MSLMYPIVGTAVAIAGADKLSGNRGYATLFRRLGWSQDAMQAAAAAEVGAGFLMAFRRTRRLGGAVLAITSTAVLLSELEHNDATHARPRAVVLLAGLAALLIPGRS